MYEEAQQYRYLLLSAESHAPHFLLGSTFVIEVANADTQNEEGGVNDENPISAVFFLSRCVNLLLFKHTKILRNLAQAPFQGFIKVLLSKYISAVPTT